VRAERTDTDVATRELTLDELKRILRDAAGEDEAAALDGDILDTAFGDLGYDSIALLEAGGRIERRYGVALEDTVFADAGTPRSLLATVNDRLGE
jgi:act minimal PKS acyl carrier protein